MNPRCRVQLRPGWMIQPTYRGHDDLGGVCTISIVPGPARMVRCLKCPECGHSAIRDAGGNSPREQAG